MMEEEKEHQSTKRRLKCFFAISNESYQVDDIESSVYVLGRESGGRLYGIREPTPVT
jgi:hypothetical protein